MTRARRFDRRPKPGTWRAKLSARLWPFPGLDFAEWYPRIWEHYYLACNPFNTNLMPTDFWRCVRASIALYFNRYDERLGHGGAPNADYDWELSYNEDFVVAWGNTGGPAHYEYGGTYWDEIQVSQRWFRYGIIHNSSV